MPAEAMLVLDASVAVAWVFEDETTPYTEAVLEFLSRGQAVVPSIWLLEVSNALVVAERRNRLKEADTTRFLLALSQLPITVEAESAAQAFGSTIQLARRYGLSTYDAAYLDLAVRLGVPLATQDRDLRQAAALCGVEIFIPS
jgi:predicted nucleic acid-binding protein